MRNTKTGCCRDDRIVGDSGECHCPVFPGKRYLGWELQDPNGLSVEEVRPIRDAIEQRVHGLLHDLNVPVTA